jgi:hypothetical protein
VFLSLCLLVLRRILQLAVLHVRSNDFKDLEIIVLRHELGILRRRIRRPAMTWIDWLFLAAASRLLPRARWRSFIITPGTLLRWHRRLVAKRGRTRVESGARRSAARSESSTSSCSITTATGHIERWLTRRPARHVRRWRRPRSGARLVSSVAIVSVAWFTSTSWRRDQICEPYRQDRGLTRLTDAEFREDLWQLSDGAGPPVRQGDRHSVALGL